MDYVLTALSEVITTSDEPFQSAFDLLLDLFAQVIFIEVVRANLSTSMVRGWSVRHVDFNGHF